MLVQKDIKKIYLYVNEVIPVTGVSLDKNVIILTTVGQTEQLTAIITPSNADDQTVTWTTSDSTVATVSTTGLVTCVTPGVCTITVTTNDGGYTATCAVSDILYEEYTFLNGSPVQTGWTVTQNSFKQGSLGSEWITAGRGSARCAMMRDVSGLNKFKIQWRCYANFATWGGNMHVFVGDGTTNSGATFILSTYATTYFTGYCNSTDLTHYNTTTTGHYIVEMEYDGSDYTASLYTVDQNDEPGTLIDTDTVAASITTQNYLYLVHEHGDGYSDTKWIKLWYL